MNTDIHTFFSSSLVQKALYCVTASLHQNENYFVVHLFFFFAHLSAGLWLFLYKHVFRVWFTVGVDKPNTVCVLLQPVTPPPKSIWGVLEKIWHIDFLASPSRPPPIAALQLVTADREPVRIIYILAIRSVRWLISLLHVDKAPNWQVQSMGCFFNLGEQWEEELKSRRLIISHPLGSTFELPEVRGARPACSWPPPLPSTWLLTDRAPCALSLTAPLPWWLMSLSKT